MICFKKDISKNYFETKYDLLTMVRKIGNDGGLALVTDSFFEWGGSVCLVVVQAMCPDNICQKGSIA